MSDDVKGRSEFREYPGRYDGYTPRRDTQNVIAQRRKLARRLRRGIWFIRVFGIIVMVLIASYIGSQSVDARPFAIENYSLADGEACPNDPVEATVTRYANPDMTLEGITTFTQWQNAATGGGTGFVEYPVTNVRSLGTGRQTAPTPVIRDAPPEPGVYRIETRYIVDTRIFGWKRTVEKTYLSDPILTVLDPTDPQCAGA